MANLSYTAAEIDERLGKTDDIGDLADLQTTDKDNLVDAVNELFTSVSDGKTAIAAAITDKGVPTAATDTFADMAQNIEDISSGGNIETSRAYTVSASGSTDITPSTGYDAMEEVALTVPAGSATPASSISATGASVSTGTNTLTLSKSVSNTPQVSAGYVSSGTAGNSSVSLTASVTTKAAATIHPSTSDQSIASGTYLTGAQTVKAVTLSNLTADNIKSGVTVKVGDSTDDDCVASVTGTYSGGGTSKNAQIAAGVNRTANTSLTAISGQTITVAKSGTYDIYWSCFRSSTSGTFGSQLYIDGVAYGTENTTFSNHGQANHLSGVSLSQGDVLTLRARSRGSNYYAYGANLTIIEA